MAHEGTRDYAAAGEIYRQRCAAGTGDVVACRRLLRAQLGARGVDPDDAQVLELAGTLCEPRNDAFACVVLGAVINTPPSERRLAAIHAGLETPCDAKHLERCEMPLHPFSVSAGGGSRQYKEHKFDAQGCELGVLDACARIQYSAAGEERDSAAGEEREAALAKVLAACNDGDMIACELVSWPLGAASLCAAHDYRACAALGCLGDQAAAEIAARRRVRLECDRVESGRYALTRPVATGIVPAPQPPLDRVEFRQLAAPIRDLHLRFQVFNRGTYKIELVRGVIYAYDAAGRQVEDITFEHRRALEPGAGTTLEVSTFSGVSFETCVSYIKLDGDGHGEHLAQCPESKPKGRR